MNCSKFLIVLFFVILISVSAKALELEELWEVTLPEGQDYMLTNVCWSPSDSLPHIFMLGRQDWTVYHMIPGQEFEPLLTLPDYPLGGIKLFGVCLDTTLESSILVHYRNLNSDSGRVDFVNLLTGDNLFSTYILLDYEYSYGYYEYEICRQPRLFFCSDVGSGMIALLYSTYHEDGYYEDILGNWSRWSLNMGHSVGWSARDFHILNSGTMSEICSHAFCFMGNDSFPDWAVSARTWGWTEDEYSGRVNIDWRVSYIAYLYEGWYPLYLSTESTGEFLALERADGPATGLFFSLGDSISYYRQESTHVWTVFSDIPNPQFVAVFRWRIIPQRVALAYSSYGSSLLYELDLVNGQIGETVAFPRGIRTIQPYPAEGNNQEFMAVFSDRVCGYRVSGFLPVEEDAEPMLPEIFSLCAYPNPFNDAVRIAYEISRGAEVELRIVDILGRAVTTLANGFQTAGKHELIWNADGLSSGIYFACFEAEDATCVQKLVHLK